MCYSLFAALFSKIFLSHPPFNILDPHLANLVIKITRSAVSFGCCHISFVMKYVFVFFSRTDQVVTMEVDAPSNAQQHGTRGADYNLNQQFKTIEKVYLLKCSC